MPTVLSSIQGGISTLSGKPIIIAPPILLKVSSVLLWKQFQRRSDSQWPFLILSRKITECFLCLCLSSRQSTVLRNPREPRKTAHIPQSMKPQKTQYVKRKIPASPLHRSKHTALPLTLTATARSQIQQRCHMRYC